MGDLVEGVWQVPAELIDSSWTIGLLFVVGYIGMAVRYVVLAWSPWLAEHCVVLVYVIDGIANLFSLTFYVIHPVINAIVDAVKLLASVGSLFSGHWHQPHLKPLKFANHWSPIKPEAVRRFMMGLPARCALYDNIGTIVGRSMRSLLSPYVCPLVRVTYPVPWLWRLSNGLLGWLSYNAEPKGAHVPGGRPGNCESPHDGVDWFCVSLGSGYVVMEILLPLFLVSLLGGLILVPLIRLVLDKVVKPVVVVTVDTTTAVAKEAGNTAADVTDSVEAALSRRFSDR